MIISRIHLQITISAVLGAFLGCSPIAKTGRPLDFPKEQDSVLFGAKGAAESSMTNRLGAKVEGLVLRGASLIRTTNDLAASKHEYYAIFRGFLLGNGVRGRYWQQQSEQQAGL